MGRTIAVIRQTTAAAFATAEAESTRDDLEEEAPPEAAPAWRGLHLAGRPPVGAARMRDSYTWIASKSCRLKIDVEWHRDGISLKYRASGEPPLGDFWIGLSIDDVDAPELRPTLKGWFNLGRVRTTGQWSTTAAQAGFDPYRDRWYIREHIDSDNPS